MWVKICGNTNLEDARLAAELGADAVGFVFAPSVRQVTAAQVAQITPHLPPGLEKVGVFPVWPAEQIAATAQEAGLTTVQLHGALEFDLIHALADSSKDRLRIIPVVSWATDADQLDVATSVQQQLSQIAKNAPTVDRVLIDSKVGGATGGTGVSFEWEAARSIFAAENGGIKLILAGGLKPENVSEAIRRLQPWGVDVSSGVEASAGRKDPKKVASLIREARSVRE